MKPKWPALSWHVLVHSQTLINISECYTSQRVTFIVGITSIICLQLLIQLSHPSLDAGSSSIQVSVKSGGLKLIQIQDNGCGIQVVANNCGLVVNCVCVER